jgi:hypothetical protein
MGPKAPKQLKDDKSVVQKEVVGEERGQWRVQQRRAVDVAAETIVMNDEEDKVEKKGY